MQRKKHIISKDKPAGVSIIKTKKTVRLFPSELKVLEFIERRKKVLTQAEISKATGVNQKAVIRALKMLEEAGHPIAKKRPKASSGKKASSIKGLKNFDPEVFKKLLEKDKEKAKMYKLFPLSRARILEEEGL